MKSINLKENQFEESVINSNGLVIVDIYADWCGPCKVLGSVLFQVEVDGKLFKVDSDECPNISSKYGIVSLPTLLFFYDGELKETTVGIKSVEAITEICNKISGVDNEEEE